MARCRKMVEKSGGGGVAFECSVEGVGHNGPCATPEVAASMTAREQWNEARLHPRTELDNYQAPPQTFPIEGTKYPHRDQPVDCLLCDERPRYRDLPDHMKQFHSSARIGADDQPLPSAGLVDAPNMHDLLTFNIQRRKEMGLAKYGTTLQANNGRDSLRDAFEESLDLLVYLQQLMIEREEMAQTLESVTFTLDLPPKEADQVQTVLVWLRASKTS